MASKCCWKPTRKCRKPSKPSPRPALSTRTPGKSSPSAWAAPWISRSRGAAQLRAFSEPFSTGSSDSVLETPCAFVKLSFAARGRVAQLGERLVRNEEAGGSNPLSSTRFPDLGIQGVIRLKTVKLKMIEPQKVECARTAQRPFGCMELWAGNERAHRSLELAGLQSDVIALPSGGDQGGDLSAVFSCSDDVARVVLADCVGHGYTASGVARHVHHLLHEFQDIRDTAGLLTALNDAFTLSNNDSDGPLRLTTVVTGTFDGTTGEFNFAYAAHPRMLLWRARDQKFHSIGEGMENFPLGYITGEEYSEQSVKLDPGDMVLACSDGATEVQSPAGIQLSPSGFLDFAHSTLEKLPSPTLLPDFSKSLL